MERRFTRMTLYLTGALVVWALDFLVVYVFAALVCARGWSAAKVFGISAVPFAAAVSTFTALAATAAIALIARRDLGAKGAIASVGLTAAVLAAIAIALTAVPAAMVRQTCS